MEMILTFIAIAVLVAFTIGLALELRSKDKKVIESYLINTQIGSAQIVFAVIASVVLALTYTTVLQFKIPQNFVPMSSTAAWLLLLVGVDFICYWTHRAAHRVNFLWLMHSVHHSSEEFNLSLSFRTPWLKDILMFSTYLPMAFFGVPLKMLVTAIAFHRIIQAFVHTEKIKKTPWLDLIIVTPSVHRVHHGSQPKYIDKNFGEVLSVWDHLFGTFQSEEEAPIYGLTTKREYSNAFSENFSPWIKQWNQVKHLSFTEKILAFTSSPGKFSNADVKQVTPDKNNTEQSKTSYMNHLIIYVCATVLSVIQFKHIYVSIGLIAFILMHLLLVINPPQFIKDIKNLIKCTYIFLFNNTKFGLDEYLFMSFYLSRFVNKRNFCAFYEKNNKLQIALQNNMKVHNENFDDLQKYPSESLAYIYYQRMNVLNLSIESFGLVEPKNDYEYIKYHLIETHDIWHTVLNIGTTVDEEMYILAFMAAQSPGKVTLTFCVLSTVEKLISQPKKFLSHTRKLIFYYRLGLKTESFVGIDWKKIWHKPLVEIRNDFNLKGI